MSVSIFSLEIVNLAQNASTLIRESTCPRKVGGTTRCNFKLQG